jgi:hypothetical protein
MRRALVVACFFLLAACLVTRSRLEGEDRPSFPEKPVKRVSADFARQWFDGNAELSSYKTITPRYGALREAELVLIYVTEPLDRRTWIKDDDAREPERVTVLKLNESLKFVTGLYPYSVLTSVFAPVDDWGSERFSPVKATLTCQEWCGHVFEGFWPGRDRFQHRVISYFASEGEKTESVSTPEGALYEDGLLIQFRELDGPFAQGGDWKGALVPALWRVRRAHVPPKAVEATIKRSEQDGTTRFVLDAGDYRRTIDVEKAPPHHVVGWTTSDGESARLVKSARLAYWKMNGPGNEAKREEIGLPHRDAPSKLDPPEGTTSIGR